MYKKLSALSFLPSVIICVVLNLILFFTVPSMRLSSPAFWIAWTFTFPVNVTVAVAVWLFIDKKTRERKENSITYLPLNTYVILSATAVYLVSGIIFMYCPIESAIAAILVELVISGGYAIALHYSLFLANRVANAQEETREKVLFIRLLQSDLESCFKNVSDEALLSRLRELSENIRYSDPMSHPSLAGCEEELSRAVQTIVMKVSTSSVEDIDADITKAQALLDFRNNRCLILK